MNQVRQLGMRFFLKSRGCRTQSEEKKVGKPAPSQAVNGSEVEEIPKQYSAENRHSHHCWVLPHRPRVEHTLFPYSSLFPELQQNKTDSILQFHNSLLSFQ